MVNKFFKSIWTIFLFLFFSLVSISLSSGEEEGNVGTEHRSVLVPAKPIFQPQTSIRLEGPSLQSSKQGGSSFEDEFQRPSGRKSTTKAMLLSLLLPGAGELYAENTTGSRIFLGLEGSIWTGFFALRTYGSWKKTDYKGYAALHAGVNLDSKTDDYFENITYYDTRDQYNQFARLYHGADATIYPENDFWNWNWDSQDSKGRFRDLRNQSKTAYRRALFMVGLAAVNRVVSVLDAARSVKKFNRKLSSEFSSVNPTGLRFSLDANPFSKNPHYYFKVKKRF
jgi:hypothetical protein